MITGNMVLGATGGGGGITDYNALRNKPIYIQRPAFTQDDVISGQDGMFMGVTFKKVSNNVYNPTTMIGGSVTVTGESPLTLTAANTVDFAQTASAMGYQGTIATFITPGGDPTTQPTDVLALSIDAEFSFPTYYINFATPGTYMLATVEELALPQSIVVNPNYTGSFLPTVSDAENGKGIGVVGNTWGLVNNAVNGYFNYENILRTLYQCVAHGWELNNIRNMFPLGSQIRATHKEHGDLAFDVVGYELIGSPDPTDVSVHLMLHDLLSGFEFDAVEAACVCANGLNAGSYYIDWSNASDMSSGDNKTWGFTLTENIPSNGVLVFGLSYSPWGLDGTISSYSSISSTTAIETVSITDITSDTTGYNNIASESGVSMNLPCRAAYGSGNFAQSGIYKYLSATGDNWWSPSTNFDRPPSYVKRTGFLSGFDPKFLAILSNEQRTFATNAEYEDGYSTDSSYTLTSKFALASYTQMGWGNNNNIAEGEVFTAFDLPSDFSSLTEQLRIKYLNGQPWWYWLASCNPSDPSRAREVDAGGDYGGDYAAGPFGGLAPVCTISTILS